MPETEERWRQAGHIASCADLRDVRLFGATAELTRPTTTGSLGYALDVNIEFQTLGEDIVEALVITGTYALTVTESGDDDGDEEPGKVAGLEFSLAAMYVLLDQDKDARSFADVEFEAFASTTGQHALYPYAREFVADMTGRMGLPPLHLGTLRFEREESREEATP